MSALPIVRAGVFAANDAPRRRPIGPLESESRIGGDGSAMMAGAVIAWARTARPGDEIVYAIGHLPAWSKGPSAMRELACDGLVDLVCDRAFAPKHYVAQRTSLPWPAARKPAPRIARTPPDIAGHLPALFDHLRTLAAEGAPMPSNARLAAAAGLRTAQQAAYALRCLIKDGLIISRAIDEAPWREIEIVRSGLRTGRGAE